MTDIDHQTRDEIVESLSLASRHLTSVAEALTRTVVDQFGNTPERIMADAAATKRALILSANAAKAAEAASEVASLLQGLTKTLGKRDS